MKKEWSIGDRVRVFGHIVNADNKVILTTWKGTGGTIRKIGGGYAAPGALVVEIADPQGSSNTALVLVSRAQCRRLKKKKELETVWIAHQAIEYLHSHSILMAKILSCPPEVEKAPLWAKFKRVKEGNT